MSGAFEEEDYRDQADFRCSLRHFLRFAEEQARGQGITPQQHLVLCITRGHKEYPRVSIGDLANSLQLRQSSTSLLIDRCVRRGLLTRSEDADDRRRVIVALTDEGQRVLDEIMRANRKELEVLSDGLFRDSFRQALARSDARQPAD